MIDVNVGPTELLILLIIFLIAVGTVAVIALVLRAGKRPCPACQTPISDKATVCPQCRTFIG